MKDRSLIKAHGDYEGLATLIVVVRVFTFASNLSLSCFKWLRSCSKRSTFALRSSSSSYRGTKTQRVRQQ